MTAPEAHQMAVDASAARTAADFDAALCAIAVAARDGRFDTTVVSLTEAACSSLGEIGYTVYYYPPGVGPAYWLVRW